MTELNRIHAYCGRSDVNICSQGLELLNKKKLESIYPDISDCKIIYSGMKRTLETIQCLYPDYLEKAVIEESLKEIDFGIFEGFTYEQLKDNPLYIEWISENNEKNVCPNGESGIQMKARVLSAFKSIEQDNCSYAIFTHGGPMACIMEYLFPAENKNRWQWQSDFGEGYLLSLTDKGWNYIKIPTPSIVSS